MDNSKANPMTLEAVTQALKAQLHLSPAADLLDRLPFSRRQAVAFITKQQVALEAALGRRLYVRHARYVASGRGAFGRSGGDRASSVSMGVFWA